MTGPMMDAVISGSPGLRAGGPLIGRREARRLAHQELTEVSFWQRIIRAIARLFHSAGHAVPHGWFGLIVLIALAVLVVVVVVFWVRPARARRSSDDAVLGGKPRTARDYRQAAQRLAADGDYAGAIVEGVRAIAAELDERAILVQRPDRTADELAVEAGRELPNLSADLTVVMRLFDDVRYGDKAGTSAGYDLTTRLDEQVRSARAGAGAAPALSGSGVPQ